MSGSIANFDASPCPTEETLRKFLTGTLDPLDVERVALHLNISPGCDCSRFCDSFEAPEDDLTKWFQAPAIELPCHLDTRFREMLAAGVPGSVANGGCDQDQAGEEADDPFIWWSRWVSAEWETSFGPLIPERTARLQ